MSGFAFSFFPGVGESETLSNSESMEKGVASLPILNMTGELLLLGNRFSHVHSSRKSNDLDDGWEGEAR